MSHKASFKISVFLFLRIDWKNHSLSLSKASTVAKQAIPRVFSVEH